MTLATPSKLSHYGNQYAIERWGAGYFNVNSEGHVCIDMPHTAKHADIYELVKTLVKRGIQPPILLRFNDILVDRIHTLHYAFSSAIDEFNYPGKYCPAFPVKVNPQHSVIEVIQAAGHNYQLGLEVGSKSELIAMLALESSPGALLLCNGYKDEEFIEATLLASKLSRRSILIVEQLYEVNIILQCAERLGIEPSIGLRMRPFNSGSGFWQGSCGDSAKFGLTANDMITAIEMIKAAGKGDCIQLLHFHMGSQVPAINTFKKALNEASRMYTEVARECPKLEFLDVGGGLAVDYDGTRSRNNCSMDYSIGEYARDVISAVGDACMHTGIPAPTIITESGRSVAAHHSVLITEVIDIVVAVADNEPLPPPPSSHELLEEFAMIDQQLNGDNLRETLHDLQDLRERIFEAFIIGIVTLKERAYAETAYKKLLAKTKQLSEAIGEIPEELQALENVLLDTYFCNFSVFQSIPDSWAIGQHFPIMPIHRLLEEPKQRATLADLTCDSDGKISRFVTGKGCKESIPLHIPREGEPYYLGIFLVGAYQEILGSLHNLFGDTNAVHVSIDSKGNCELSRVIEGDTIATALGYAQYNSKGLQHRLDKMIERALKEQHLTENDAIKLQKKFKAMLNGYTYLVA
jgi:arginine decarboxylase